MGGDQESDDVPSDGDIDDAVAVVMPRESWSTVQPSRYCANANQ